MADVMHVGGEIVVSTGDGNSISSKSVEAFLMFEILNALEDIRAENGCVKEAVHELSRAMKKR